MSITSCSYAKKLISGIICRAEIKNVGRVVTRHSSFYARIYANVSEKMNVLNRRGAHAYWPY
ncbi:hypothetical protein GCM10010965_26430 [Caldalkalibacillus thermarum]|nr:hypothetical protein GCM10010965_26430 [Caldalkalibacillus thermarum]